MKSSSLSVLPPFALGAQLTTLKRGQAVSPAAGPPYVQSAWALAKMVLQEDLNSPPPTDTESTATSGTISSRKKPKN